MGELEQALQQERAARQRQAEEAEQRRAQWERGGSSCWSQPRSRALAPSGAGSPGANPATRGWKKPGLETQGTEGRERGALAKALLVTLPAA